MIAVIVLSCIAAGSIQFINGRSRTNQAREANAELAEHLLVARRAADSFAETVATANQQMEIVGSVIRVAANALEEFPPEQRVALSSSVTVVDRLTVSQPEVELSPEFRSLQLTIDRYRSDLEGAASAARAEKERLGVLAQQMSDDQVALSQAVNGFDQQVLEFAKGTAAEGEQVLKVSAMADESVHSEAANRLNAVISDLSKVTDPAQVAPLLESYVEAVTQVRALR